jgi:saccharopine dehydrogenase-like NADP-dependent oxidoreductase
VSKKFVRELNDNRLSASQLDVTDNKSLKEQIKKNDLIVNTIGPFSSYGISIMKTAIESKINYIDICDDIVPTVEALRLDKSAKDSNVFLLLSMGWFPGTSNLRAKELADQMSEVEEIVLAWVTGKKSPEEIPSKGLAGVEHFMRALTGKILTYRDGHKVKIAAHQKGVKLSFPEPLGEYTCYQIEHPETETLPYYIPSVKKVSVLGSLYPKNRNKTTRFFTSLIDFHLISIPFYVRISERSMRSKKKINLPMLNASYISCIGKKDGKRGQLTYSEVNTKITTAEATSQPLACTIFYIASGDKIQPGVHLPETVIKIDDLIKIGKQHKFSFVTEANQRIIWSEKINHIEDN